MPVTYKINSSKNITLVKGTGKVTARELFEVMRNRAGNNRHNPDYDMLCDFRKVTQVDIQPEELSNLLSTDARLHLFSAGRKVAVVASTNIVYGVARMYEMLSEQLPQQIMVFREMDKAKEWLGR